MQTIWQDVQYALRQLRRAPGFMATAILTLALGIGATTAIFTLVYQVILRSIPVEHPEQLYKVGSKIEQGVDSGIENDWWVFSDDLYKYLRDRTPSTAGMVAVQSNTDTLSARRTGDQGLSQPLSSKFVSGNYFSVLGVKPYAGRMLGTDDDREGAQPTAVLSYTAWQMKFAADPGIVGSTVMLSGHPVTIVGVADKAFYGERNTTNPAGLWLPLALEPTFDPDRPMMEYPSEHWLDVLVRVPEEGQVAAVQNAIRGELHQWLGAHREFSQGKTDEDLARQTTELASARGGISNLRKRYGSGLQLLQIVAGFVLLIACANLANLMLVRGMARQQELAVRSALGAPRARLVRQMLVEAILLSVFGGMAALIVAYAGTHAILTLAMRGAEISPLAASPSLPVLGFALLLSLVTGVIFGIAPAWITSRSNPVEALRGANRSTSDASAMPQKILVILQAALSLALLSTAGLLITSLRNLEHQDFHFETQGRLLLAIDLHAASYQPNQLAALYQQFDDRLARVPGVQSFAYATYGPMSGANWNTGVSLPGVPAGAGGDTTSSLDLVSPEFFGAIGTPVMLGRTFNQQDTATSQHVAVVNKAFVDRFFPGKQPIGEHFGPDPRFSSVFEIVGVVDNAKFGDPTAAAKPMFFTPIAQSVPYTEPKDIAEETFDHYAGNIVIRYRGSAASVSDALRQTLKSINPDIPILSMRSYQDELGDNFLQEELVVRLTSLFGMLALVLASVGLYGVTAYAVARRTGEIGIRMALGATRGSVLRMIVENALTQAGIGLAIGLPLAYFGGSLVRHSLYQTSAFQPMVLLVVIALLLLSATAAALIPARRAASIDPMKALRTE
jgi:predicted permease